MDIETLQNKELLVRKRLTSFLEKLMKYCGYDIDHDVFKKIMYIEEAYMTDSEAMIKHYFDAYLYLLNNRKNSLTKAILNRFFYIVDGKEPDQSMVMQISSEAFHLSDLPPIEQATRFHMEAQKCMKNIGNERQLILSLMFFNYILVKHDIPTIHFLYADMEKYELCRQKYFESSGLSMIEFMFEAIKKSKFQNKSYYENLVPLNHKDICETLRKDKDMLINKYQVKSMSLFGSFVKRTQRIDSDIDILVAFSQDLTYDEKVEIKEKLSKHYFDIFHRFIDFTEVTDYVNDALIDVVRKFKKIY